MIPKLQFKCAASKGNIAGATKETFAKEVVTTVNAPLCDRTQVRVTMPLTMLPRSAHDLRIEALSRSKRKRFKSSTIREDITMVVDPSERDKRQII